MDFPLGVPQRAHCHALATGHHLVTASGIQMHIVHRSLSNDQEAGKAPCEFCVGPSMVLMDWSQCKPGATAKALFKEVILVFKQHYKAEI
jgi:hypothetical protein